MTDRDPVIHLRRCHDGIRVAIEELAKGSNYALVEDILRSLEQGCTIALASQPRRQPDAARAADGSRDAAASSMSAR